MTESAETIRVLTIRYDTVELMHADKGTANALGSLTKIMDDAYGKGWELVSMTSVVDADTVIYTVVLGKSINLPIHQHGI